MDELSLETGSAPGHHSFGLADRVLAATVGYEGVQVSRRSLAQVDLPSTPGNRSWPLVRRDRPFLGLSAVELALDISGLSPGLFRTASKRGSKVLVAIYDIDPAHLEAIGRGKSELKDKSRPEDDINRRVEIRNVTE
jgi:hypothetical protein